MLPLHAHGVVPRAAAAGGRAQAVAQRRARRADARVAKQHARRDGGGVENFAAVALRGLRRGRAARRERLEDDPQHGALAAPGGPHEDERRNPTGAAARIHLRANRVRRAQQVRRRGEKRRAGVKPQPRRRTAEESVRGRRRGRRRSRRRHLRLERKRFAQQGVEYSAIGRKEPPRHRAAHPRVHYRAQAPLRTRNVVVARRHDHRRNIFAAVTRRVLRRLDGDEGNVRRLRLRPRGVRLDAQRRKQRAE